MKIKVPSWIVSIILIVFAILLIIINLPFGLLHLITKRIYTVVLSISTSLTAFVLKVLLGEVPEEVEEQINRIEGKLRGSDGDKE